jgi:hypothetical protein
MEDLAIRKKRWGKGI